MLPSIAFADARNGELFGYKIGGVYPVTDSTLQKLSSTELIIYAHDGHVFSQYFLAGKYYKGEGVEKDYAKAFKLYRKAAERQSRLGEDLSATNIFNICQEEGINIHGLTEDKQGDEKAAPRQIGKHGSRVFNNTVQVEIDTWTVTRSQKHVPRGDCNGTMPMPVYTIIRKEELIASEDDPF